MITRSYEPKVHLGGRGERILITTWYWTTNIWDILYKIKWLQYLL